MTPYIDRVKLFTDGGCRGNPGPGAIGVLILNQTNEELDRYSECIGNTTNNRAEYRAVIQGLNLCAKHTRGRVTCYSDSELLVNQMSGTWRLKNDQLRQLFFEVKQCEQVFAEVVYTHVKRTNPFIRKADRLANEAIEGR
jgi:ribonuclease HI